jgi:hypothetical protein
MGVQDIVARMSVGEGYFLRGKLQTVENDGGGSRVLMVLEMN